MTVKSVCLCTASDVLPPTELIAVHFENMPEVAIRPTACVCFQVLKVACNY